MIQVLKRKFEDKIFISSIGDARSFCMYYGLNINFTSRIAAKTKIFHFIASELDDNEVKKIIDETRFSGPSRLGPIAEAIRRNGRASKYHY